MPKRGGNISLTSYDDIFETDESRAESQLERVQNISISELVPFKDHPFKVVDDEAMLRTTESIAQYGVLTPLIARPLEDGGYEIISGHRRAHAAEMAGLTEVPVLVRQMDDDAATVLMVDSNLQRENILPSERAYAYKMKMEAMKRQAGRPSKENPRQVVGNYETADLIGQESGESGRQVQRYIRLTNLIPELLEMVDQKQISFNPAVELSYLAPEEQEIFMQAMDEVQASPSLSQAQRLKKLAQEGDFTMDAAREIMNEVKKGDLERVTFRNEQLRKYFPRSYTTQQMQDTIIKLLDQWQKKKARDQER
jgi:ParB family chromosome partitioning protein